MLPKRSAHWTIILDAYWSHRSDISCGSNVVANLNISKQVVYIMEPPVIPGWNLWLHKYCTLCSMAPVLQNNGIAYKTGAVGIMMSGIGEKRSKYIQKLTNISGNVSSIFLENFKESNRFKNTFFLIKAHSILVHARVHQIFNLFS